jgi:hypothetical protein
MIDGSRQFQVSKIARVRLVVQISQTRIIGTAINRLALDLGFISRDTSRDFTTIDGDGLSNRVLALYRKRREGRY